MPPRSAPERRRLSASYALAPLLTVMAILGRLRLSNDHGPILIIMLLPIFIVGYLGGIWPGLLCTALAAMASDYFLLEPLNSWTVKDPLNQLDWIVLIAAGGLVSVLGESALRTNRRIDARFRDRMLMLNQTYGGLFVWEWDGPISFWNSTAEKLYGYSAAEAQGRIGHDLLKTTTAKGGMTDLLSQLEKTGAWEGDLQQNARDGRCLTVSSRMLLVREPGRSFVVEANEDVTESRRSEEELKRVQHRFETAFRLSPLGKLAVRIEDDRIIEVNESYARLIGAPRSEIAGKTLTEHNPLLQSHILSDVRKSLLEGKAITGIDVQFLRKDGTIGAGVLYAEILEGAPDCHALVVLQDVTTHQQAEDRLRLANYDLQQFAYAAAHDLQEPTRNISTTLGLFYRTYRSSLQEEGLDLIQDSINAAKRMNQMIRDLLAFTHADHEASLARAQADANESLRQVLEQLKRHIDESGAEITSDELPVLAVHPIHLLQLLQNLIGNSLKYHAPGVPPLIHVGARIKGSNWTLSIADNGIGFDSTFAKQIFGVFKRLQQGPEYSGNGIGLAICERIVRLYGGRIWAESAPGNGATFYLTLPAAELAIAANSSAMRT